MRLVWTKPAIRDVYRIVDFYEQIDPDLALKMGNRLNESAKILIDHPHIGTLTGRLHIRKWLARGTPFLLLYRPFTDRVEIRSVVDARSDWRSLR